MISFQNPGLIDVRAIKTMGVSVKEIENPIGYFGTGLKYAIAIVLRERGSLSIWRGLEEFRFETKDVEVRGKPVSVVTMNDEELGFTIDLGKNWEPWQAFREFWCNAKDEGGRADRGRTPPAENATTVHLAQDQIESCLFRIDDYFALGKPICDGTVVAFHDRPSESVFYRNVRVGETGGKPFRYSPDVVEPLTLTEDRTIKSDWDLRLIVAKAILLCSDPVFLESWLTTGPGFAEHTWDLDWEHITPGPTFLGVAKRLAPDTSRMMNLSAIKVLARHDAMPDAIECELLDAERDSVREAIEFCRALAYPVDEFPVTFVESLGDGILGKADRRLRRILIARCAINAGDLTLAGTLLEEWIHIKHGHRDGTREMQNFLLDALVRIGREYLLAAARRTLP